MNGKTRQKANQEILFMLKDLIEENPDLRFFQLLEAAGVLVTQYDSSTFVSMGYKNGFYEESDVTLGRMLDKNVLKNKGRK